MSTIAHLPTLLRAARTDSGIAWAYYSLSVERYLRDPSDEEADAVRDAFRLHVFIARDREPTQEEYEAVETVLGRRFPPVLSAETLRLMLPKLDEIRRHVYGEDFTFAAQPANAA